MSLTVCASSTDDSYTTTAAVKLVLGVTASSDDAFLSLVIGRASRWADNYVGAPLSLQSYSETVAGYGRRRLMLARGPLRSVTRVFDATDTGEATQVLTSEYGIEREAGMLTRDLGWDWTVPEFPGGLTPSPASGQEYQPWLVDYAAGYTYAGIDTGSANWSTEKGTTSTGRTLPEDIEHAVILRTIEIYANREDVTMEKLGDIEVNYRSASRDAVTASLSAAEESLDPYRRLV